MASPTRKKYPFFEKVLALEKVIGASEVYMFKDDMTLRDLHWFNYLLGDEYDFDTKMAEWIRRARLGV